MNNQGGAIREVLDCLLFLLCASLVFVVSYAAPGLVYLLWRIIAGP